MEGRQRVGGRGEAIGSNPGGRGAMTLGTTDRDLPPLPPARLRHVPGRAQRRRHPRLRRHGGPAPLGAGTARPRRRRERPADLRPAADQPAPVRSDPAARQSYLRSLCPRTGNCSAWWVARMVATTNPAQEKLTLLLHGHFPTAISKVGYARSHVPAEPAVPDPGRGRLPGRSPRRWPRIRRCSSGSTRPRTRRRTPTRTSPGS